MKKNCLTFILLTLTITSLTSCGSNKKPIEEDTPLEIGDTVKEWSSKKDYASLPMVVANNKGTGQIVDDLGNEDKSSLLFNLTGNGYIGSDIPSDPYFTEEDAKNGDSISLAYYLPEGHNIKNIKLEAIASSNSSVSGDSVIVNEENVWKEIELSYDSLYTLGSIRLNYTLQDASLPGSIYIDNIKVVLGEETVKTGYEGKDESLWKTYEDYFKVGCCISGEQIKNTEFRKIVKDNFNSITAENEGKPERVLDQAGCQAALKDDPAAVVITTEPFEKIYDWAAANNIGVRHHTFVWYSQTPSWFFTTDYTQNGPKASRQLMIDRMENFIKVSLETINERWPEVIYAVDVANEAIENGGIRNNNNNWYSTIGADFIYYAFKFAYEYKADWQELYYNDYSYDYDTSNCAFALNTLLKDVIAEELIDGVGIQGHIGSDSNMNNIITDGKMIKEKGLKCQLTELDITVSGTSDANFETQKKAYKELTKKILESNAKEETDFNAYVVWGITDDTSWKSYQNPLLFTKDYAKKPAYYGVLEAIDEAAI